MSLSDLNIMLVDDNEECASAQREVPRPIAMLSHGEIAATIQVAINLAEVLNHDSTKR